MTQVFYLCDTAQTGPHRVIAGPFAGYHSAVDQATELWFFEDRITMPGIVEATWEGKLPKELPNDSIVHQRSESDHGSVSDHVACDIDSLAEMLAKKIITPRDRYMVDDNSSPVSATRRVLCAATLAGWHEAGLGREVRILGRVDDGHRCAEHSVNGCR